MNKLYPEETIQSIADAIRSKTGETSTMTVSQMPAKISNIKAGGIQTEGVQINPAQMMSLDSLNANMDGKANFSGHIYRMVGLSNNAKLRFYIKDVSTPIVLYVGNRNKQVIRFNTYNESVDVDVSDNDIVFIGHDINSSTVDKFDEYDKYDNDWSYDSLTYMVGGGTAVEIGRIINNHRSANYYMYKTDSFYKQNHFLDEIQASNYGMSARTHIFYAFFNPAESSFNPREYLTLCKLIFPKTSVVSLTNYAIDPFRMPECYVPDNLYDSYCSATNWCLMTKYIFKLSEYNAWREDYE